MALTDPQRAHIHELFYAYSPPIADSNLDLVSQALDDAIASFETWAQNNIAGLVSQLPEPFKSRTNAYQKWAVLALIAAEHSEGVITIPMPESE